MLTIEKLREQIDDLDNEIINLLNKRFNVSLQIGKEKAKSSKNILDKSREQKIYNKIVNADIQHKYEITNIYTEIMKMSKEQQNNIKV